MRILVIGGTYFLGKAFVEQAYEKHQLHLLNRGNRPVVSKAADFVTEYHADRHDIEKIRQLSGEKFDVVVDFCAYEKGDIKSLTEALGGAVGQYIFISTCDVYRRGTGEEMDENAELEDRSFGGEAGAYISGKVALEEELAACGREYHMRYTSIRPAFIYGPDNYAPREGLFFNWIEKAGQIIYPEDAEGEFQLVYVKDVAKVILAACGNPKAYDKAYNICGECTINYETFAEILKHATGIDFERVNLSVRDIQERNIPLPFPLTREETQRYRGELVKELGVSFTPIEQGMRETFKERTK